MTMTTKICLTVVSSWTFVNVNLYDCEMKTPKTSLALTFSFRFLAKATCTPIEVRQFSLELCIIVLEPTWRQMALDSPFVLDGFIGQRIAMTRISTFCTVL